MMLQASLGKFLLGVLLFTALTFGQTTDPVPDPVFTPVVSPVVTIDCGSPKDKFFVGGGTYKFTPVSEAFPDGDIRHGTSFTYNIPVKNGSYHIQLAFLEVFPTYVAGSRKFHVDINGTRVLENFDISATTPYGTPVLHCLNLDVKELDGIQIKFTGVTRSAIISKITVAENDSPESQIKKLQETIDNLQKIIYDVQWKQYLAETYSIGYIN